MCDKNDNLKNLLHLSLKNLAQFRHTKSMLSQNYNLSIILLSLENFHLCILKHRWCILEMRAIKTYLHLFICVFFFSTLAVEFGWDYHHVMNLHTCLLRKVKGWLFSIAEFSAIIFLFLHTQLYAFHGVLYSKVKNISIMYTYAEKKMYKRWK